MALIGQGYSSRTGTVLERLCIDNTSLVHNPNSEALLKYSESITASKIITILEVGVGLSIKIDLRIGSVTYTSSLSFCQNIEDTRYKHSYHFALDAKIGETRLSTANIENIVLTDGARDLYDNNYTKFVEECGDKVVIKENNKIGLYFSVVIDFASRLEKDTLKGGMLGSPFSILFGGGLSMEFYSYRSKVSLHIYQTGLDLSLLKDRLSEFNWEQNYGNFTCEDIETCKEIATKIYDYAAEDFVELGKDRTKLIEDSVAGFETIGYEAVGIPLHTKTSDNTKETEGEIIKQIKIYEAKRVFLEKILSTSKNMYMKFNTVEVGWNPDFIRVDVQQRLKDSQILLDSYIQNLKASLRNCYDESTKTCEITKTPEELELIHNFEHAYLIQGMCDDKIIGPRFILPVDTNFYVENTRYNNTPGFVQEITNWYRIIKDGTSIILEAYGDNSYQVCQYTTAKEENYKLIDLYTLEENISPECRKIVCLDATEYTNIKGEIIYQEDTPL